jgi:hypothetical protein
MYEDVKESVCLVTLFMSPSLPRVVHFCRYFHRHTYLYIIVNGMKFILTKFIRKIFISKKFFLIAKIFAITPKYVRCPLLSQTGNYYTHLAGFLWGRHVAFCPVYTFSGSSWASAVYRENKYKNCQNHATSQVYRTYIRRYIQYLFSDGRLEICIILT